MIENDAAPQDVEASLFGGGRWKVDPEDSSAEFVVKTFWGLLTVRGQFGRVDGWLEAEAGAPDQAQAELRIEAASLDTGNAKRDKHLRSADFFDAENHPTVTFAAARIGDVGDGKVRVSGSLEAAGEVAPLELDATVSADGGGLTIEGDASVDRRLLGMNWSPLGMVEKQAKLHVRASLVR